MELHDVTTYSAPCTLRKIKTKQKKGYVL